MVDGKSLSNYAVPIVGKDIESQTPQFFMGKAQDWHPVPAGATIGESTFIRLRWRSPLQGGPLKNDAELFRQSLSSVYDYTYGRDGSVEKIVMRRAVDRFSERIVVDRSK